jgi:hypothetical protein
VRLNETRPFPRFSRRAVHFPAFSDKRDRRMRVGRNPFGGIFLRLPLKSIADTEPNETLDYKLSENK